MGYDCDDEANCVVVPLCDESKCRTSLDVRMHNIWYDLSGWRKAHPAGSHWIDWFDGRDATEVMDAFHSDRAQKMLVKLPKTKPEFIPQLEESIGPISTTTENFRKLRAQLVSEGWWERDVVHESKLIAIWMSLLVSGIAVANSSLLYAPFLAIPLMGLFFTQSGWLGHDYVHGIDKFTDKFRQLTTLCAGLGVTWWR